MNEQEFRAPRVHSPSRSGVGWLLMVIVLISGAAALMHAFTRNKTVAVGRQQAAVEREIAELEQQMRALDMRTEEALSRKNLTELLASRRTKLRDISPEDRVIVPPLPTP